MEQENQKLLSLAQQIQMEIPIHNKLSDYESISSVSNDQRIVPIHSDLLLVNQNSKNEN